MTKKSLTPVPSASKDLVDFNIRQLKALFPNVFSEGKIDFDALKNELGDNCNTGGEVTSVTNLLGQAKSRQSVLRPHLA
ncbi:hypothetical protein [Oligella urethralis]|uniref:hypothetical protein n=1 Tax=Oligella urethralis TaxID=90245 RepID=UPI001CA4917A|nr:hypothetical protein [Oligella urethralis]